MKEIIQRFKRVAVINVMIVSLLSSIILFAWLFYNNPAKNFFARNLLSNPVTCLCFLLSCLSLICISSAEKTFRSLGKVLATLILLIGLIKFSEILLSYSTGIDTWLFTNKLLLNKVAGKPIFMAPNTALCFSILGIALLLFRYKINNKNLLSDYFASAAALIALASLIGYLYKSSEFYHVNRYNPMTFGTALSFFLLSTGILLRRSEFGFFSLFTSNYEGSKTARFLIPFAVIIPVTTGFLRLYGERIGLYSSGIGLSLFAITNIILFLFVIWRTVLSINAANQVLEAEIEERKITEKKLVENQQLLESIIDNTSSFIHVKDLEGKYLLASNYYEKMLGINKQDMQGKTAFDLFEKKEATRVKEMDEEVLKENKLVKSEVQLFAGGELRSFITSKFPVKDAEGKSYAIGAIYTDITEIKNQNSLITDLYDNAPSGYYSLDSKGYFIKVNNTTLEWLGYTKEELLGKPVTDFLTPEGKELFKKQYPVFKETGVLNNIEFVYVCKNGAHLDVLINSSAVKNEFGDFLYSRSTIFDITERKKLQEEIEKTNLFLDTILEHIPHMVFVKDAKDLRFVRFNKAGEKLIGLSKQDILGKNDHDLFPQDLADHFTVTDREVLNKGVLHDIKEELINTPDGERLLHTKKVPIKDGHGAPLYLLGISEDITEQKKIEAALQETNEKFLRLFYASPLALVIRNIDDGTILDVNEEYERLLGYKKEELIGKTSVGMGIVLDPQYGEHIRKNVSATGSLKNIEATLYNSKKEPVNVIVSIEHIRLGNKNCIISGLLDITGRKQTEMELQMVNRELESFTYSVSHDLRAPLRIINGYAEIIKDDADATLSEDGKRMLQNIVINAKRMGDLIDDLLNFSRLGRRELVTHNTDMNAIVQEVADQQVNGNANYTVKIEKLPPCLCDSSLIKQVWENLISNAVKYSGNNPRPAIEIGSLNENDKIVYYIKDNGAGFDMNYYDKLFAVFQRLHKGSEFEGTGVGLALSQRIIAKHKGKIWAESKINEGSTFYFTIGKS